MFFCVLGAAVIALLVFVYSAWLAPKPDAAAAWNEAGIMEADGVFGANTISAAAPADGNAAISSPQEQIIGKWEAVENGDYFGLAFFADETVRIVSGVEEVMGTYTIDDTTLTIYVDGETFDAISYTFGRTEPSGVPEVDTLTITGDGDTLVMARVDALTLVPPAPSETPVPTEAPAAVPIVGAWETYNGDEYNGMEYFSDGNMRLVVGADELIVQYTVSDNVITLLVDGVVFAEFNFEISGTDALTLSGDMTPLTFNRVAVLNPPAAEPTGEQGVAGQDPSVVFANGFANDILTVLSQTWWGTTGTYVNNPDAQAAAAGYPIDYAPAVNEVQYVFDVDAMTVQVLYQEEDGTVTDVGLYDFTLDPFGFYVYAFERTENIDGEDHTIKSKFFVCDGVLYEVELVDDIEASNYVAHTIVGP